MSHRPEIYELVKAAYQKRQEENEKDLARRRRAAYGQTPRFGEIDREIAATASEITKDILSNGNIKKKIRDIQKKIDTLNNEKKELLDKFGLPENYLDMHYACEKCHDTGYNGIKVCKCLDGEYKKAAFSLSTLGAALAEQTFDSFKLSYYSAVKSDGVSEQAIMKNNLKICKDYAESFKGGSESIFMMGGTGIGKTHLASAIAHRLLERGFSVVYVTAPEMFSILEREKFGREEKGSITSEDLYDCDMLIIDDLGSEFVTPFVVSALFAIINTRTIKSLSTIITTNLTLSSIEQTYNDKIASRIMGEFIIMHFKGKDIRLQKKRENSV